MSDKNEIEKKAFNTMLRVSCSDDFKSKAQLLFTLIKQYQFLTGILLLISSFFGYKTFRQGQKIVKLRQSSMTINDKQYM